MTSGKPTIDDVAALAGVARVTVSRVLNDGPNVSAKTRKAVMEAVSKLQFTMNIQARSLAGGRSRTLGFVHLSDVATEPNSFYHSALELGALRACARSGFQLSVETLNQHTRETSDKIVEMIKSGRHDGLILTPPFSDDITLLESIKDLNYPVVAISGGTQAQSLVPTIGIDDEQAGYDIASHLLSLGHRRFAYIKGLEGHVSANERYLGYVRALTEAGLDADAMRWEQGNFTFRAGIDLTAAILGQQDRPSALICANDDMAVGALFTAHKSGVSVPGELSIAGFDDTTISEIIWPPITTIHQPLKEMGRRAAERLFARLGTGPSSTRVGSLLDRVPHRLVVRASSAPPA